MELSQVYVLDTCPGNDSYSRRGIIVECIVPASAGSPEPMLREKIFLLIPQVFGLDASHYQPEQNESSYKYQSFWNDH